MVVLYECNRLAGCSCGGRPDPGLGVRLFLGVRWLTRADGGVTPDADHAEGGDKGCQDADHAEGGDITLSQEVHRFCTRSPR